MNTLPDTGFIRLKQLVGDPKANPPIPPIVPIGKSTLWQAVKKGAFPAPIKLSPGVTVWRVEDIRSYIENTSHCHEG